METITVTLMLLLGVVISGFLARIIPVPRPLVQIALGAGIGYFGEFTVTLNPYIFMFLFLPPLLFLDGWRIPKEGFRKDIRPILGLALGLVVFTVLGMGLFIHWLIPAMPIPVAFALAAVISPTDPIAVSAIAQRVPIPKRLMHILEGESLLNDASGLVCLRFAVAAMLTGVFSLSDALMEFVWVAVGGVLVGVGVTVIVNQAKGWLSGRYGEESGSHILISLLIPFGSYMLAEELHCSGILAAVAAGIAMSFAEFSGQALADTRVRRNTVWDMIQFAANGIIFVLLGEQLPAILEKAVYTVWETGHHQAWWLIIYVLAINIGLGALRFAWVYLSLQMTILVNRWRKLPELALNWRLVAAMSFAGVRGAITLAGVLTLPLTMNDGSAFPARDLAIFLAMGVIIVSLVVASIFLPFILKGIEMPKEGSHVAEEERARVAAAQAAITEIDKAQQRFSQGRKDADIYVSAASRVMEIYRSRIENQSKNDETQALMREREHIEREFYLAAISAERNEIFRLARARKIDSETATKLVRELDLQEARYTG